MTERLYYTNAYLAEFRARVADQSIDGLSLYLNQSAFYPTSGGQPHDHGTLGGIDVIDVIDEGDRVRHVLSKPLAANTAEIEGTIDWTRRFDLMQQHTGQHLLSAMFEDRYGWSTVSVHFGSDSATLDIVAPDFDTTMLKEAERVANALIFENREVSVSFEDATSATGLRKASDREGTLRIVNIAEVDRSACGGTHVRRTGEIGVILLRRAERAKGHVRVEFLCGQRAVNAARHDFALLMQSAMMLNAAVEDLPRLVESQQQQLREWEREGRRLRTELATFEGRHHWESAVPDASGIRRIVIAQHTGPVKTCEGLAQAIVALGQAVVIITSQQPAGVMLATSADSGVDAGQSMRAALVPVGGRGGGSPRLAQGTVPDANQLQHVVATLSSSSSH